MHNITIWTKNSEVEITSFDNLSVDPFTVGQTFYLDIEDIYPIDKDKMLKDGWHPDLITSWETEWKKKQKNYHNKKVLVVEKFTSLDVKKKVFRTDVFVQFINN